MTATERSLPSPFPGAVAGVGSYLAAYLATYLWQASDVREALRGLNALIDLLGGDPIPAWKAVGWLLYNAHFVDVTFPALAGGRVASSLIADGGAPATLYLFPPLLLVAAGALVARHADATAPRRGALAGASVVLGYAPLALVGVFAFRVTVGAAVVGSDPVTGVLLAGVAYPLAFGAIGGVLAALAG